MLAALVTLHGASAAAQAEDGRLDVNDIHPPIGISGEVARENGGVVLSYRYQRQGYDGLQSGRTELSGPAPGFPVSPTALKADTHLLEVMWAPFEEITFLLTLPYLDKELEQLAAGSLTTTEAKGFGDFTITVLYRVFENPGHRIHLNLGLSLPSGSITESYVAPNQTLVRQPYIMQLGSGTVDLRPGATYNGLWRRTYWGGQLSGVLHAGTNSAGYRLGNEYQVTAWVGQRLTSWLGTGFRLNWQHWFNPDGFDPLIDQSTSPANDPTLQAGRRLDALFSLDLYLAGEFEGTRLSVEAGLPAYQFLEGPQLRTQWIVTAGLQYAFE